jgi:hypothetical protein
MAKLKTEARRKRETKLSVVVTHGDPPADVAAARVSGASLEGRWTTDVIVFFDTLQNLADFNLDALETAEQNRDAVAKGLDAAAEEVIHAAMRQLLKPLIARGLRGPKKRRGKRQRSLREKASLASPVVDALYPFNDIASNVSDVAACSLMHRRLYEEEGEPASPSSEFLQSTFMLCIKSRVLPSSVSSVLTAPHCSAFL